MCTVRYKLLPKPEFDDTAPDYNNPPTHAWGDNTTQTQRGLGTRHHRQRELWCWLKIWNLTVVMSQERDLKRPRGSPTLTNPSKKPRRWYTSRRLLHNVPGCQSETTVALVVLRLQCEALVGSQCQYHKLAHKSQCWLGMQLVSHDLWHWITHDQLPLTRLEEIIPNY